MVPAGADLLEDHDGWELIALRFVPCNTIGVVERDGVIPAFHREGFFLSKLCRFIGDSVEEVPIGVKVHEVASAFFIMGEDGSLHTVEDSMFPVVPEAHNSFADFESLGVVEFFPDEIIGLDSGLVVSTDDLVGISPEISLIDVPFFKELDFPFLDREHDCLVSITDPLGKTTDLACVAVNGFESVIGELHEVEIAADGLQLSMVTDEYSGEVEGEEIVVEVFPDHGCFVYDDEVTGEGLSEGEFDLIG